MVLEWIRRQDDKFDGFLKEFLFSKAKSIVDVEHEMKE
jgi:hypothetical protein